MSKSEIVNNARLSVKIDLKETDYKSVTEFGTFPDVRNADKENVVSNIQKPEIINKTKLSVKTGMRENNGNKTEIDGKVSTTKLCIPPEVMTSPISLSIIEGSPSVVKRTLEETNSEEEAHSISDHPTVINHNILNLDSAAVQTPEGDQVQVSSTPAVDQVQFSFNHANMDIKDILNNSLPR